MRDFSNKIRTNFNKFQGIFKALFEERLKKVTLAQKSLTPKKGPVQQEGKGPEPRRAKGPGRKNEDTCGP